MWTVSLRASASKGAGEPQVILPVQGQGLGLAYQRQRQAVGTRRPAEVLGGEGGVADVVFVMVGENQLVGIYTADDGGELDVRVGRAGVEQHAVDEVHTGGQDRAAGVRPGDREIPHVAVFAGHQHR